MEEVGRMHEDKRPDSPPTCKREVISPYWRYEKVVDKNMYRGYLFRDILCDHVIKYEKVKCFIVKATDNESAIYNRDMADYLGEGAARVLLVDNEYIVMEDVPKTLKEWYQDIFHDFKEDNWAKYIERHLRALLKGFMKAATRLFLKDGHGNWKNGIVVMENGQGKLCNFNFPPHGKDGFSNDLKFFANIIENMMDGTHPAFFDYFGGFDLAFKKNRGVEQYKAKCSNEFANFMTYMRNLISREMKYVAPLYPTMFWRPNERFYFMELIYDYIWKQRNMGLKYKIEKYFDKEWSWTDLVPKSGALFRRLDKMLLIDEEDGTITRVNPRNLVPPDSIVYWRNCCHHYNDKLDQYEKVLTAEEIELQLNEKLNICENVFHAMCSFIFKDIATRSRYDWVPKAKVLLGYICEHY